MIFENHIDFAGLKGEPFELEQLSSDETSSSGMGKSFPMSISSSRVSFPTSIQFDSKIFSQEKSTEIEA